MSRLRNRMVNAEYYTDPELLRWPAAKRDLYRSMWAMAEDSACIEDDPFGWKCAAFPSPLDSKSHSVAKFTAWRTELIEAGKAVSYEADGGHYLFLPDMAEHEHPRNPQSPNLPLPEWITWQQNASDLRKGAYTFDWLLYKRCTTVKTTNLTVPVLPCPVLKDIDQPRDLRSRPRPNRKHGSYPQADPEPVIAYYSEKLDRDLTTDEKRSVKRWVNDYGPGTCSAGIGYAAQGGFAADFRRTCGQIKALCSKSGVTA